MSMAALFHYSSEYLLSCKVSFTECSDEVYLLLLRVCQADEDLSQLRYERTDLMKRLEEDQEDLNELMKKHKALIAQV